MESKPSEPKAKRRRVTLAQAIAQAVAKIPGAIGWKLVRRRGRMEVQVEVKDGESQCELTRENMTGSS